MKKIAIIGASSGIGLALSNTYTQQGNTVDSFSRDTYDLSNTQDITKISKVLASTDYDIVIFSAGVGYHRDFYSLESQQIREQVMVNTLAPLEILRNLKQNTKFVYLSSVMQYIPAKNMSVYAASKRATSHTLQAIRAEKNDIQILNLDLGAVKTQMHIKAGMKKMIGRDIEHIMPKLIKAIDYRQGTTTLFWDWWIMIYIIFPLYRIFLNLK